MSHMVSLSTEPNYKPFAELHKKNRRDRPKLGIWFTDAHGLDRYNNELNDQETAYSKEREINVFPVEDKEALDSLLKKAESDELALTKDTKLFEKIYISGRVPKYDDPLRIELGNVYQDYFIARERFERIHGMKANFDCFAALMPVYGTVVNLQEVFDNSYDNSEFAERLDYNSYVSENYIDQIYEELRSVGVNAMPCGLLYDCVFVPNSRVKYYDDDAERPYLDVDLKSRVMLLAYLAHKGVYQFEDSDVVGTFPKRVIEEARKVDMAEYLVGEQVDIQAVPTYKEWKDARTNQICHDKREII
ncbi:MAG: hypothetical protein ACPG05_03290 [Bdellovibrionales bacterium]